MATEFFQYQVDRRWYHFYWVVMLVFSVVFISIWLIDQFLPGFARYTAFFATDISALILASVSTLYLLTGFLILKRSSLPFATLIGAMFFTTSLMNGLTLATEKGALLYIAGWLIVAFLSGIYGLPMLAGSVFLVYLYCAIHVNFVLTDVSMPLLFLIISSTVLAILSYFFWRTRFVSIEMQKVSQLSGMLRSNKQQSEILIESIRDGIVMFDTSGKITLMNPAAASMSQWPIAEAVGVDVQMVIKLTNEDDSDVQDDANPFDLVFVQKQHTNQTLVLVGREGKKQVVSLAVSPVILPNETAPLGAVALMRDISEERAAEKQRAEFISTASHEMRTPVAAIEGYLALALSDKVSTIDTRARSYLEKAHASTQHLGKLFQDLLTSSKAEDGRLSNHPSVVEMGAFMQQLTDDLKFTAEKKGLIAEFVIGGADETIDATTKDASVQHLVKPLYYVHVDADRIREVITDLFDNACKYTDSGKISIGLTGNVEVVQIYIRDTGSGIPAEDVPHLFQKFYRVDNSATRTIGGTGLGLFISRKIVELYHGRIWVESKVGQGSTFFINLPRLTTQRATEIQGAAPARPVLPTPDLTSTTPTT